MVSHEWLRLLGKTQMKTLMGMIERESVLNRVSIGDGAKMEAELEVLKKWHDLTYTRLASLTKGSAPGLISRNDMLVTRDCIIGDFDPDKAGDAAKYDLMLIMMDFEDRMGDLTIKHSCTEYISEVSENDDLIAETLMPVKGKDLGLKALVDTCQNLCEMLQGKHFLDRHGNFNFGEKLETEQMSEALARFKVYPVVIANADGYGDSARYVCSCLWFDILVKRFFVSGSKHFNEAGSAYRFKCKLTPHTTKFMQEICGYICEYLDEYFPLDNSLGRRVLFSEEADADVPDLNLTPNTTVVASYTVSLSFGVETRKREAKTTFIPQSGVAPIAFMEDEHAIVESAPIKTEDIHVVIEGKPRERLENFIDSINEEKSTWKQLAGRSWLPEGLGGKTTEFSKAIVAKSGSKMRRYVDRIVEFSTGVKDVVVVKTKTGGEFTLKKLSLLVKTFETYVKAHPVGTFFGVVIGVGLVFGIIAVIRKFIKDEKKRGFSVKDEKDKLEKGLEKRKVKRDQRAKLRAQGWEVIDQEAGSGKRFKKAAFRVTKHPHSQKDWLALYDANGEILEDVCAMDEFEEYGVTRMAQAAWENSDENIDGYDRER